MIGNRHFETKSFHVHFKEVQNLAVKLVIQSFQIFTLTTCFLKLLLQRSEINHTICLKFFKFHHVC